MTQILLSAGLCFGHSAADETLPKDMDLYLLIGQSNMAGRAQITEAEQRPLDGVYLFDGQGGWVEASNPLNRFSPVHKGMHKQRLGPGYSFAKALRNESPDRSIGLIVHARGGSKIEQWTRGSRCYDSALKRAKAAQNAGTLKGILWHQGEDNRDDPEYLPKLEKLVQQLREDLKQPELPFVAGQISKAPGINAQIAQLPEKQPHCAVVSAEGLSTADKVHFDTPSALLLGERFATAMQQLAPAP